MSRHFERSFTTDHIVYAPGSLVTADGGPMSAVIVFRMDQTGPDQQLMSARRVDEGQVWNILQSGGALFIETSAGFRSGPTGLLTDTWYMYLWSKNSGSAVIRDHLCEMATDTWTHTDRGGALADGTGPVDHLQMGDVAMRLDGYIAAGAVAQFIPADDAAVEAMRPGLAEWLAGGFSTGALWRMDDTPVDDLTGNGADQTLLDGTTVDLGVQPPSFSYVLDPPTEVTLAGAIPMQTAAFSVHATADAALAGSIPMQAFAGLITVPFDVPPTDWIIEQGAPVWQLSQA